MITTAAVRSLADELVKVSCFSCTEAESNDLQWGFMLVGVTWQWSLDTAANSYVRARPPCPMETSLTKMVPEDHSLVDGISSTFYTYR